MEHPTDKKVKIIKAYKKSKNIYDDVLTKNKLWTKLYIDFFWGVDDIQLAETLLAQIPDDFSGKLLDVPFGTGVFTCAKYSRMKKAEIHALDYSKDMLESAKRRSAEIGLDNISFVQGDVGSLPYEDESFKIVFSMNGFHVFPDTKTAFVETARVLKRGGVFTGCFYIKGQYRRSDFVVNSFLKKKGWFNEPFYTKDKLEEELNFLYSRVELKTEKAMALFKCVK